MDTQMHDLNLRAITTRLNYTPTCEEAAEAIYDPKSALIVPTSVLFSKELAVITSALGEGDLVIENKVTKKRIHSDKQYHIATPMQGGAWGYKKVRVDYKEVVQVLANGGFIVSIDKQTNACTTFFSPGDEVNLVSHHDDQSKWNQLCAAAINYEIEQTCFWSTNGAYAGALTKMLGTSEVVLNTDVNPTPQCMSDYTVMVLSRVLEASFNTVFDFVSEDRSAFYNAVAVPQGVRVQRYADARAFIWHTEKEEQKRLQELAEEEGKVGNY